jgi:hypothetical protein
MGGLFQELRPAKKGRINAMNAQRLVQILDELSQMLRSTGKTQPATHIENIKQRIATASTKDSLREQAGEVRRMGALARYANFNSEEESLLAAAHDEAVRITREGAGHDQSED